MHVQRNAELNSTSGYWKEMCLRKRRIFLLRKIHEKRGTLWYHAKGCKHVGQCDAGRLILSFLGKRIIATLRNDPIHKPKSVTKTPSQLFNPSHLVPNHSSQKEV